MRGLYFFNPIHPRHADRQTEWLAKKRIELQACETPTIVATVSCQCNRTIFRYQWFINAIENDDDRKAILFSCSSTPPDRFRTSPTNSDTRRPPISRGASNGGLVPAPPSFVKCAGCEPNVAGIESSLALNELHRQVRIVHSYCLSWTKPSRKLGT